MESYDRPVQFTPVGRVKDLNYGIELAGDVGCPVTFGEAARSAYQQMIESGLADLNDTELFEFFKTR